jgi:hypothetical protein
MNTHQNPLKHFEEDLPHTRATLLKLWGELAPKVQAADPSRYHCVEEALEQDLPFPVLLMYVFRESRRALEGNHLGQRAAQ